VRQRVFNSQALVPAALLVPVSSSFSAHIIDYLGVFI
jgi:hypothetical protein